MKRFTFRLERVRELRERAERAQAAVLGAALGDERRRLSGLDDARRALETAREQSAGAAGARSMPAGALRNLGLARDAAERDVERAAEQAQAASERVHEEQARYGDSRRDLRVVERLKEKRLETWREEASRDEQRTIDGVALRRHQTGENTP